MSTELEVRTPISTELQEKVLLGGDLSKLTAGERLSYYQRVCESVGLNPLTRPFEYLTLNNRLVLYARKDCTDQLRDVHGVSVEIVGRELVDGVYVVTAKAKNMVERTDESIGAVPLPANPADKANAMMKAETKAKRRVTLSICGLGMLDESELDTVPEAKPVVTVQDHKRTAHAKIQELRDTPLPQAADHRDLPPPVPAPHASDGAAEAPTLDEELAYYRRTLAALPPLPAAINDWWQKVPETLHQDLFTAYTDAMKVASKAKK